MGAGDKAAAASVENQSFRPGLPSLSPRTNTGSPRRLAKDDDSDSSPSALDTGCRSSSKPAASDSTTGALAFR